MTQHSAPQEDGPAALRVVPETDEIVALSLEGEFDLANASRIVEEGERALANANHLIVDLSKATFIDSSVIAALFGIHKQASAHNRLAVLQLGTAAIVEKTLELSRVERIIPRANTRAEAIDTIQQFRPAD